MNLSEVVALLGAKFAGARKDVLMVLARTIALQATTIEEAKAVVDKLTDAQVTEFTRAYRSEVDKEIADGTKTFEANLKKKYDLVEKKPEPGGGKGDGSGNEGQTNDIAAIVKEAVSAAVKPFEEKLQGYERQTIAETRTKKLNEVLAACKDEVYKNQSLSDFARMTFKDDADFDEFINSKTEAIKTVNQNKADLELGSGIGSPLFSQKGDDGISKGVADFVKSQQADNNNLAGKEI